MGPAREHAATVQSPGLYRMRLYLETVMTELVLPHEVLLLASLLVTRHVRLMPVRECHLETNQGHRYTTANI
jgi:hypothetical protein